MQTSSCLKWLGCGTGFTSAATLSLAISLALFGGSSVVLAEVKPGDVITAENPEKVRDLVSPGVYYKVAHGMSMKIVPTQRIEWPPPYKEANEKDSQKVESRKVRRAA